MPITTYAELQTAIDNWLADTLTTARSPEFIALFEATANRRLRVRQQQTSSNLTPSSGTCTVPTDFLEWIRVTRLTGTVPQDMTWMEPGLLQVTYPQQVQIISPPQHSVPAAFFTIEGSSLLVRPIDDSSSVQLLYYAKVPALSVSATTNWLLTAHPDLYLFGSLVEASMYRVNDERGALWKARRDELFDEIERLSRAGQGTGAMHVMAATP